MQTDCTHWLAEVTREVPSVYLNLGTQQQSAAVTLSVDGQSLSDFPADGLLELDPGMHQLTLNRPGHPPLTRQILAQQGVRARVVDLALPETAPSPDTPDALVGAPVATKDHASRRGALAPWALAGYGLGAVGFGAFAIFGLMAKADNRALRADCPSQRDSAPEPGICLTSEVDARQADIDAKSLQADIGLAAGLVGMAGGLVFTWLNATRHEEGSAAVELRLGPSSATVTGHF